jgi:hypothetical protein
LFSCQSMYPRHPHPSILPLFDLIHPKFELGLLKR